MALALFDLDDTVIHNDSDYAWSTFMMDKNLYPRESHEQKQRQFKSDYLNGSLDIVKYCDFVGNNLSQFTLDHLAELREEYLKTCILPYIYDQAIDTIKKHKNSGDFTLLISATNSFIVKRIGQEIGFDEIIATDLKIVGNRYTGEIIGVPSFREGKVTRIKNWLKANPQHHLKGSWFYSDSRNDIPLLELVDHPVAVNPDETLKQHALNQNWKILNF